MTVFRKIYEWFGGQPANSASAPPKGSRKCVRCGASDIWRLIEHGLFAEVMNATGRKYYECRACLHRFYLRRPPSNAD